VKGKILSAKKYIDASETKQKETSALKAKDIPKLWRYKSQIYMYYIAMASSDDEVKADVEKNEEAMEEAILGSAQKCKDTDVKGAHWPTLKQKMNMIRWQSASQGVGVFNEKKYEEAYDLFTTASKIADMIEYADSLSYYNAGLACEKLEKYAEAEVYYGKCAKLGYQGALTYVLLAQAQNKQKKPAESNATLEAGLDKYPGNMDLIKEQLNGFLLAEEFDKAEEAMGKVIAKEPNNPVLHFSIGTIYDNLKKYELAEKSYNEALKIDPDYFDALYSKGVSYFNQAVELYDLVETLTDVVEQDKETSKADSLLNKALPILEKAHGLQAADINTMSALKQIYGRLGEDDKWLEMKKKLANAEK
jgi:tetratricopeptide (TPR) repeat protein